MIRRGCHYVIFICVLLASCEKSNYTIVKEFYGKGIQFTFDIEDASGVTIYGTIESDTNLWIAPIADDGETHCIQTFESHDTLRMQFGRGDGWYYHLPTYSQDGRITLIGSSEFNIKCLITLYYE